LLDFASIAGHDAVHGEDAVEVVRATIDAAVGMLQGSAKPPQTTSPSTSKMTDVRLLEQVVLLEELHRLPDHVAAAPRAGGRAARLHAEHAAIAFEDEILGPQLLGVEVHCGQGVDHGRSQALREGEGAVVLRVAADLQHALADAAEGDGEVGGGRALPDAALSVDGEDLRAFDLLGASMWTCTLPSPSPFACGDVGNAGDDGHAAVPIAAGETPSIRSSSSSPAWAEALQHLLVRLPVAASCASISVGDAGRRRVGSGLARRSRMAGSSMKVCARWIHPGRDLAGGG
jgi:hypothetical protein